MNQVFMFPERAPKAPPTKEDWETEYITCKHWDRPPRSRLSDPPFYPWVPSNYNVTFKLNFK